jgi:hypothetical protein
VGKAFQAIMVQLQNLQQGQLTNSGRDPFQVIVLKVQFFKLMTENKPQWYRQAVNCDNSSAFLHFQIVEGISIILLKAPRSFLNSKQLPIVSGRCMMRLELQWSSSRPSIDPSGEISIIRFREMLRYFKLIQFSIEEGSAVN